MLGRKDYAQEEVDNGKVRTDSASLTSMSNEVPPVHRLHSVVLRPPVLDAPMTVSSVKPARTRVVCELHGA